LETKGNSGIVVSQAQIDTLVTEYITTELRPLSTVDKQAFKNLVEGLAPGRKVLSRKALGDRINSSFDSMTTTLRNKLSQANYICTTADLWTARNRSYLGMTVHIINDLLERESFALACRRMKGSHTYDLLAEAISEIHSQFNLTQNKLVGTVTDNASNFHKAFKEYEGDADDEEEDLVVEELSTILHTTEVDNDVRTVLPPHYKCCCHTINLVATTDAQKALTKPAYSRAHHSAMGKCQAVWNKVNKSSKASDAVRDICGPGISFLIPVQTRWFSTYNAICRINELAEYLPRVCTALDIVKFKPCDLDFLKEYITVMEPLAVTLDKLQGEKHCFLGILVPELMKLRNKLITMRQIAVADPLRVAVLDGLNSRYSFYFDLNFTDNGARAAMLAAISHPGYKLVWIPPYKRMDLKQIFRDAVFEVCRQGVNTQNTTNSIAAVATDTSLTLPMVDEYGYELISSATASGPEIALRNRIILQTDLFLEDSGFSIDMLNNYPDVKKAFLKYNTVLPSSAPVERLFSIGGLIETPRRNRLSDEMFEKLLMLKVNNAK
jgi:hypothetical protein